MPLQDFDAQSCISLDTVMRLYCANDVVNASHHGPEAESGLDRFEPIAIGMSHLMRQLGASDQRFARHATVVEAVAAHLVALDEGYASLDGRSDVRGHESRSAGADHDQIAIEARWLFPLRVHASFLHGVEHALRDQGKQAQQGERQQDAGRENARERFDLTQLSACIHVDESGGQHAS